MLWIRACHVIAMVAWFAGLFYLPRLFVYHNDSTDQISVDRFKLMEKRLYYAIMWPAAGLTTIFGTYLLTYNWFYYQQAAWLHGKLLLVAILWGYHLCFGYYLKQFRKDIKTRTTRFYRIFNEIPTLLLVGIVVLVVVKP